MCTLALAALLKFGVVHARSGEANHDNSDKQQRSASLRPRRAFFDIYEFADMG